MTPNNNFNILPIYETLSEQNARKWWVYGLIYPLFSPQGVVPPFQIKRTHLPETAEPDEIYTDSEILGGTIVNGTGEVWSFYVSEGEVWDLINVAADGVAVDRLSVSIVDSDDAALYCYRETEILNHREIAIPADAIRMYVQITPKTKIFEKEGSGVASVDWDLLTAQGELIDSGSSFGFDIITREGYDYLINNSVELSGYDEGQYYLRLTDGVNTWYTDVFTWVKNDKKLIRVVWWDDADFIMDAGEIIYDLGGSVGYENRLYLKAEIAKPTYPFEEEVETRDGYMFPIKMISSKQYHFNFLAPEYLLDVLRLLRMADHIEIDTWKEDGTILPTYRPDSILVTPEWENNGDLAAVAVEFQTDTIAKKINFVQ